MWPQEMVRSFSAAGLPLKVLDGPLQPRTPSIFQLDIRASERSEYFRLWPGAPDIRAAMLDIHPEFRQVLFQIQEPRRRYEEIEARHAFPTPQEMARRAEASGGKLLRYSSKQWVFERWTPEGSRRYLAGFDEHSLFICQVEQGNTVDEAHRALKPVEVLAWEARAGDAVQRQGEWFFLPIEAPEREALMAYVATHPRSCRQGEAIAEGGRPHLAEHVARVEVRRRRRGRVVREAKVYVRGGVTHADHRTRHLADWHRAIRNREIRPAAPDRERMRWID